MRHKTRAGVATLALICGVAFAAAGAFAQTSGGSSAMPAPTAPAASQNQINPTDQQTQAIFKSLEDFASQFIPGFMPAVGTSAPQDLKLQPMPPQAAQALPEAKDHHVAKMDDNTIVLVDPITRQIVGVVSSSDPSMAIGPPKTMTPGGPTK